MNDDLFADLRPYNDNEVDKALQRMSKSKLLPAISAYLYPDQLVGILSQKLKSIHGTAEFQSTIMRDVVSRIIMATMTEFSYSGVEYLSPDKSYLFVSNHRDIVLDSTLLQYVLICNNLNSSHIAAGGNLMFNEFATDLAKCNKLFFIPRGGQQRDFYQQLSHISDYIRYVITQLHESVWIAQRNGRTKDGMDLTAVAILKMFALSGGSDLVKSISELNIVPVSISYEWEPCDMMKAKELSMAQNGLYEKSVNDDWNSVLTGFVSNKGRVHLSINKPVSVEDIESFPKPHNAFFASLANLLDSRIVEGYHLSPNNYIAFDLISDSSAHSQFYTPEQKEEFLQRYHSVSAEKGLWVSQLQDIFLSIYANPIVNKNKH